MIRSLARSWWTVAVVAVVCMAVVRAHAEPSALAEEAALGKTGESWAAVVLGLVVVGLIGLGSPLFVIIAVLTALCFWLYADGYDVSPCLTLSERGVCGYDVFPAKMADLSTKNVLLAIPFFVVSGAIMSAGDIANRLVNFARAIVGWLPGGLAIATVGGCIFFAAISGSSPVTVIAIGAMMYPALKNAGYEDRFSIGLVTTAGSLGILIPPSIPMLVFAIVASSSAPIDVGELFLAGILPGLLIGLLLSIYSVVKASTGRVELLRGVLALVGGVAAYALVLWGLGSVLPTWVLPTAHVVLLFGFCLVKQREAFWALMLPILILGGIYSGLFTPTEAAAVSVVYALVIELFVHRELTFARIPKIIADSAVMMGTLLIIMALAFGLNDFLVQEKIPDLAVAMIEEMQLSTLQFLLIINLFLLMVGALMDSISAILVIAPLLAPIAVRLGIDPIHLGVIFIVNLEIGYLTPPIGINLFVASAAFEKSMGEVIRAVVPFILLMFVGLGVVTYVPSVALGPVNVLLRKQPFYAPLPAREASSTGGGQVDTVVLSPGEGSVRSMNDITAITEQLQSLCYLAEDIVDDDTVPPAARVNTWLERLEAEDITDSTVVALATSAAADVGTKQAYRDLQSEASGILRLEWQCAALETILGAARSGR